MSVNFEKTTLAAMQPGEAGVKPQAKNFYTSYSKLSEIRLVTIGYATPSSIKFILWCLCMSRLCPKGIDNSP